MYENKTDAVKAGDGIGGHPSMPGPGASSVFSPGCAGFTLIEIVVAMTILSIGLLGIAALTGTAYRSASYAQGMTQATNAAQNRVEALLGIPYANLEADLAERPDLERACAGPGGPADRPVWACVPASPLTIGVAPDTKSYTWSYTVTWIDINGDGIADSTDGLKRIDVTVEWADPLARATNTTVLTTLRARE